jgi:hypothetical protein
MVSPYRRRRAKSNTSRLQPDNALERTNDQRGRAFLAMNCVLGGAGALRAGRAVGDVSRIKLAHVGRRRRLKRQYILEPRLFRISLRSCHICPAAHPPLAGPSSGPNARSRRARGSTVRPTNAFERTVGGCGPRLAAARAAWPAAHRLRPGHIAPLAVPDTKISSSHFTTEKKLVRRCSPESQAHRHYPGRSVGTRCLTTRCSGPVALVGRSSAPRRCPAWDPMVGRLADIVRCGAAIHNRWRIHV